MEAFATLNIVGNVIQLVEVSTKLVKTTIKLTNSASRVPDEINDTIVIRDRLVFLLQEIGAPGLNHLEHDRQLEGLVEDCRKVCRELLAQVNHIKGKGDLSKTGVLGVAWRTLVDGGKLNSIEQRLERYRSQILAHILVMLDHKQSSTYSLIESSITQQNAHAQSLRELIGKTKNGIIEEIKLELNNTQLNTVGVLVEPFLDDRLVDRSLEQTPKYSNYKEPHYSDVPSEAQLDLLAAVRTALTTIVQASKAITIQDWLCFPELLSRESAIHDAHENTYTWLLCDGNPNESVEEHDKHHYDCWRDRERSRNRDAMCNWLKGGSGAFYISGKAGSGKPTLMKYLARAPQTREYLDDWAKTAGKDLILAEFFFWRSGTPLQRDIEGLYRGILWKILDAHPGFIRDVFSAFWGDKDGNFDGKTHRPEPTLSELEAAFDILIKSPTALSKHRVCLFIDGLDEFEGDYWKLSQRLAKWCTSDDIKICVSSRPRNEFSKAFDAVPGATWFSIHSLTKRDMLRFVRDTFERDLRYTEACAENPDCASLFYAIVDRAEGVFLWVRLVVGELLIDMGNSWSLVQLQQKLDEVPSDLRSLFDQMLRRVNRLERVKLARTFMMIHPDFKQLKRVRRWHSWAHEMLNISVYAQAVLDDIADNPGLETQLLDRSLGPYLSKADCISKCSQMCRRLIGRCQGLLDIVKTNRSFPNCHTVSFFHRSVVDFLKEPEIESYIRELVGNFNPRRALAHILLARFKFVRLYENPFYHADHRLISPNNDETIQKHVSKYCGDIMRDIISLSTDHISLFEEVDSLKRMVGQMECPKEWLWYRRIGGGDFSPSEPEEMDLVDLDSVILCNVISVDDAGELAREIIRRSPSILDNPRWNPLLSAWLAATPVMGESKISLIRLLLEGGVSPNTKLASKVSCWKQFGMPRISSTPSAMTPWMLALWNLSLNWSLCGSHKTNFLRCIELLLSHGADPSVCFVGYKVHRIASDNNSSPKGEDPIRSGPYYADLMTMMDLWGLHPTKRIRRSLQSNRLPQAPSKLGRCFRRLRRRKRALVEHIHPLQLDFPNNAKFQITCVLPRQALIRISITELEEMPDIPGGYDQACIIRVWNAVREGRNPRDSYVNGRLAT